MTLQPKTAIAAFNGPGVQLSIMKKELGETVSKAFLAFIVTELIESFNVGKTMNDMQVVFAVNGIEADYYFLKPEELKFIFDNAKKGKYGTMYDRIDAAVIFGWIETYLVERTQIAIDQNIEKNKSYNSGTLHPDVAAKMRASIKETLPVDMSLSVPVQREKTEHEILIQDIFKEFDSLWRDKPIEENEQIRTIPYLGKNITQDQFLFIRLEELDKL